MLSVGLIAFNNPVFLKGLGKQSVLCDRLPRRFAPRRLGVIDSRFPPEADKPRE